MAALYVPKPRDPSEDLRTRFEAKVTRSAGCWQWGGWINEDGYGEIESQGRTLLAHRVAYELMVGPIPTGLVIDHLCRNRSCVNPAHMEPVTKGVNNLRGVGAPAVHAVKTHCVNGHEFTPENTYIRPGTDHRDCRTCRKAARRKAYAKERAALGKEPHVGQTGRSEI